MKTTIKVQDESKSARVVVSVDFKLIDGESYRSLYLRKCNFAARISAGRIKEFQPKWYKEAMATVRNQRAA